MKQSKRKKLMPEITPMIFFLGKETIHKLYGTRVAVLAGDFMFAQSSWYLATMENLQVIKLISQVTNLRQDSL
jgi:hypothetical protein